MLRLHGGYDASEPKHQWRKWSGTLIQPLGVVEPCGDCGEPRAYHRCSPERTAALEALEAAVEAFHDSGDPDAFYAEVARTLSASTRTRP